MSATKIELIDVKKIDYDSVYQMCLKYKHVEYVFKKTVTDGEVVTITNNIKLTDEENAIVEFLSKSIDDKFREVFTKFNDVCCENLERHYKIKRRK